MNLLQSLQEKKKNPIPTATLAKIQNHLQNHAQYGHVRLSHKLYEWAIEADVDQDPIGIFSRIFLEMGLGVRIIKDAAHGDCIELFW